MLNASMCAWCIDDEYIKELEKNRTLGGRERGAKQKKSDLKNKLKEVEEIKKKYTEVYKQKSLVL